MPNPIAFASALAILSGALALALYGLAVVGRDAFRFVFSAQFLGADVSSLLPRELPATGFLATLVALVVSAWLLGFCWVWLHNRLAAVTSGSRSEQGGSSWAGSPLERLSPASAS